LNKVIEFDEYKNRNSIEILYMISIEKLFLYISKHKFL